MAIFLGLHNKVIESVPKMQADAKMVFISHRVQTNVYAAVNDNSALLACKNSTEGKLN